MTPEGYFFIYAFPSYYECVKTATEEQMNSLKDLAIQGRSPPFDELKKLFTYAFKRIKEFKKRDPPYSLKDYRDYWWFEHNRVIDNREEGYENAFKEEAELCKVSFRTVDSIEGNLIVLSKPISELSKAVNYRDLVLKKGDAISIHKGMVVEKISEEDYQKLNKATNLNLIS